MPRGGFGPKCVASCDALLGHRAHRRRDPDGVTGFAVPVYLDGGYHLGGVTDNFDPHIGREETAASILSNMVRTGSQ